MEYKRLELYVWWTCNQKCTYCMEFPNMERKWSIKLNKYDILKRLIKYKKVWYNHVTLLWWEPFIQEVFLDALKLAKKMQYTVLVTTNCTTLHLDSQASKYLSYIDELIISFEAIDKELQQKISRTNVYVDWEKVFDNIKKYWNWKTLKANIVITQDNKNHLFEFVEFLYKNWVKDISITYPDIDMSYYWKEHILSKVSPKYSESVSSLIKIKDFCNIYWIRLKIVDFPFCIFPKDKIEEYIKLTDDFDYQTRIKSDDVLYEDEQIFYWEINRDNYSPRERKKIEKCDFCYYKNKCWGISKSYEDLYWISEINPIKLWINI